MSKSSTLKGLERPGVGAPVFPMISECFLEKLLSLVFFAITGTAPNRGGGGLLERGASRSEDHRCMGSSLGNDPHRGIEPRHGYGPSLGNGPSRWNGLNWGF